MGPVPGDGLCVYSKCSVPVKQGCFPRLLTLGGAQGPPRCALFSKVPQSALLGDPGPKGRVKPVRAGWGSAELRPQGLGVPLPPEAWGKVAPSPSPVPGPPQLPPLRPPGSSCHPREQRPPWPPSSSSAPSQSPACGSTERSTSFLSSKPSLPGCPSAASSPHRRPSSGYLGETFSSEGARFVLPLGCQKGFLPSSQVPPCRAVSAPQVHQQP